MPSVRPARNVAARDPRARRCSRPGPGDERDHRPARGRRRDRLKPRRRAGAGNPGGRLRRRGGVSASAPRASRRRRCDRQARRPGQHHPDDRGRRRDRLTAGPVRPERPRRPRGAGWSSATSPVPQTRRDRPVDPADQRSTTRSSSLPGQPATGAEPAAALSGSRATTRWRPGARERTCSTGRGAATDVLRGQAAVNTNVFGPRRMVRTSSRTIERVRMPQRRPHPGQAWHRTPDIRSCRWGRSISSAASRGAEDRINDPRHVRGSGAETPTIERFELRPMARHGT